MLRGTMALMQTAEARALLQTEFSEVAEVAPVGRPGAWSRAFTCEIEVDGVRRELVTRFGTYDDDFAKDELASRWSSPALPVPAVRRRWRAGEVYAIASDRHTGVFLEDLDAAGWRRILPHVWAAIDTLRRAPVDLTRLPQPLSADALGAQGSWSDWLCSIEHDEPNERGGGWSRTLADSPTGDGSFQAGIALLRELTRGLEPPRSWVHSDLLHGNVLVAPDGHAMNAIFDWGCLHLNDYLYDVAWLEFWAPWHAGLATVDVRQEARQHFAAGDPLADRFDERMRICCLHIGLCHLAYHAFTGELDQLAACDARMARYDARA